MSEGTFPGMQVTERIDGTHPKQPDYPLLPGDLIAEQPDGDFAKIAPGLGIVGFELSDAQRETLQPVTVHTNGGLEYAIETPEPSE